MNSLEIKLTYLDFLSHSEMLEDNDIEVVRSVMGRFLSELLTEEDINKIDSLTKKYEKRGL